MNKKFLIYFIAAFLLTSVAVSCNSSSSSDSEPSIAASNVSITSFSLVSDDDVLENLDSVFFTIDLNRGLIYNADSLPLGTDVSRLCVSLESAGYEVNFNVKNGTRLKSDTTFTYSESDSIDFTGDVKILVTADDQVTKRTYNVKVNVHKMKPDSMSWDRLARRDLPSLSGEVTMQRSVKYKNSVYCLMIDKGRYVLATGDNPATREWTKKVVEFPFNAAVRSLTATSDALYMTDAQNGTLYTSTDFTTWTSCGVQWTSISGAYLDKVLGVAWIDGSYKHVAYPAIAGFESTTIDSKFPISKTSDICTFTTKWSTNPMGLMIGGVDQNNNVVGDTWGFDGKQWAKLSTRGIVPHSGMVLVPYFTFDIAESSWKTTEYSTWIAIGGRLADGTIDNTVYVSRDNGVNWNRGDSLIQMPDYVDKVAEADALLFSTEMYASRAADEWTYMPTPKIPAWCHVVPAEGYMSRATTAVTKWDCPYIYMIGGFYTNGSQSNNIWRGVLNRLTFKPLY